MRALYCRDAVITSRNQQQLQEICDLVFAHLGIFLPRFLLEGVDMYNSSRQLPSLHMHTSPLSLAHTLTHIHTCVCTCTCTHPHTHTHTHSQTDQPPVRLRVPVRSGGCTSRGAVGSPHTGGNAGLWQTITTSFTTRNQT